MPSDKVKKDRFNRNALLTEACPRMRQRLRREFIPEFGAWLLLIGQRYEHQIKTLQGDLRLCELPSTIECIRWCKTAVKVIDTLLAGLWETVPRREWDDVCDALRTEMEKLQLTGKSLLCIEETDPAA